MPYKDPEKAREAKRKAWQKRYDNDPAYRQAEAEKKADWRETDEGREKHNASSLRSWHKVGKKKAAEKKSKSKDS